MIGEIFRGQGVKVGVQEYSYTAAGKQYKGKNVYAVLEAPRGDATESMVLAAGWKNMEEELNVSGVALVLALSRYFKRKPSKKYTNDSFADDLQVGLFGLKT